MPWYLEGHAILSSNWEAWNPCSLDQRADSYATRLNPPPQIDRTTHADQLAGLWTYIQLQSQIRLVSSAADWCSPCSDDEIRKFKIMPIHGMIPKANWVLATRHYTSCCKMSSGLLSFLPKTCWTSGVMLLMAVGPAATEYCRGGIMWMRRG